MTPLSPHSSLSRIRIGSAPDSWGVWFPDDPAQVPWSRFLDEVAQSGYEWIELGPYGYLPTDPALLTEETARRGLKVSAGTVFTGLHHGEAVWDRTWAHVADNAALAQAMGARHLVSSRPSGGTTRPARCWNPTPSRPSSGATSPR